jgi:hypothetical protein
MRYAVCAGAGRAGIRGFGMRGSARPFPAVTDTAPGSGSDFGAEYLLILRKHAFDLGPGDPTWRIDAALECGPGTARYVRPLRHWRPQRL